MTVIHSAVACNLDTNLLLASLPLFESEKVQAIEWSFDTLFAQEQQPDWFSDLLHTYGREGRLIGHGVFFSLFSGRWTTDQQQWLARLKTLSSAYSFDHITEHFGFMTGADFHKGAPISIPFTSTTLAIGRDRLSRIQDACQCPAGLENLAFAYSLEEVKKHGDFLNQLIEPINGFIILDLHNLYCQLHNFDVDFADVINLYPLDRVREIHVSGGSWSPSLLDPARTIRRDTHDDAVPDEVFTLLENTIPRCPNLRYVVLEQLGSALDTDASRQSFQQDFLMMDRLVQVANGKLGPLTHNSFLPKLPPIIHPIPLEDALLGTQQDTLSVILETATSFQQAQALLGESNLARTDWATEKWEPVMIETALAIAQKWKAGFR